jgi:hypothetical protein
MESQVEKEKGKNVDQKAKQEREEKSNILHRIDLVRIEEGYEKLKNTEEKEFIIGLDNQEYQAQIEFPPK